MYRVDFLSVPPDFQHQKYKTRCIQQELLFQEIFNTKTPRWLNMFFFSKYKIIKARILSIDKSIKGNYNDNIAHL